MKMTRHILLAFAAVIAVACTKHSPDGPEPVVPDPLNSYIFFEAGLLDVAQTKANLITSLPTTGEYTAFGVMGYYADGAAIFNHSSYTNNIAKVYRTSSGVYIYDHLAPWMGTTHKFHAFCPYELLKSNVNVGTDKIPYIEYTQPTSESGMRDILGAFKTVTNTGHPVSTSTVEMQFQHLLWAFELSITNSQTLEVKPDGTTIENPSITITKVTLQLAEFPEKANLFLNEGYTSQPLTTSTISPSYIISSTPQVIAKGETKVYGPLLFIPVPNLKYKILIEYTTAGGAVDQMTYPATGYKTAAGPFNRATRYSLSVGKNNDKFFKVEGFTPVDWTSKDVNHEFN